MGYFSIWPFFVCLAVIYGVAATPLFKLADTPPSNISSRSVTLDGLRGFLALGVVFFHGAFHHVFQVTGKWDFPPSRFYIGLGQGGVSVFFMITGYLFWGKILREQPRGGGVDWTALYIGRLFRIGPVYLLGVVTMLVVVGFETGWALAEPPGVVGREVAKWLALGSLTAVDVNGRPGTYMLLAGVTWSLQYEWAFYASLLILAPVLRLGTRFAPSLGTVLPWLLPAVVMLACFVRSPHPDFQYNAMCCALFCIGMTVAACPPLRVGPDWARSCAVLACVGVALTAFPSSYEVEPSLLLGLAFALVAAGCTVFGVLTTAPARRLGDISYGIYLLQGLPLAAVFLPQPLRTITQSSPLWFWTLLLATILLLIVLAMVVHVWVERPGIALGRHVVSRVRRVQVGA